MKGMLLLILTISFVAINTLKAQTSVHLECFQNKLINKIERNKLSKIDETISKLGKNGKEKAIADKSIIRQSRYLIDRCQYFINKDKIKCISIDYVSIVGYYNNHSNLHEYLITIVANDNYYVYHLDEKAGTKKYIGKFKDDYITTHAECITSMCDTYGSRDFLIVIVFSEDNVHRIEYCPNLPLNMIALILNMKNVLSESK